MIFYLIVMSIGVISELISTTHTLTTEGELGVALSWSSDLALGMLWELVKFGLCALVVFGAKQVMKKA